jgi:hypothetical protein
MDKTSNSLLQHGQQDISHGSAFIFKESRSPGVLGICRNEARRIRKSILVEGVEWSNATGKVLWTDAALKKAREHLLKTPHSEPQAPAVSSAEKTAADSNSPTCAVPDPATAETVITEPEMVLVKMVRRVANPNIVLGEAAGAVVRVRVRSAEKLTPGMEMPCRHIDGDLYELACRCPRWRGRF